MAVDQRGLGAAEQVQPQRRRGLLRAARVDEHRHPWVPRLVVPLLLRISDDKDSSIRASERREKGRRAMNASCERLLAVRPRLREPRALDAAALGQHLSSRRGKAVSGKRRRARSQEAAEWLVDSSESDPWMHRGTARGSRVAARPRWGQQCLWPPIFAQDPFEYKYL
jgi:hypothetical protein